MKAGSWVSIVGIYLFGVCGGSTVSKIIPLGGDIAQLFNVSPDQFGWLISFVAIPAALLAIPSGIVVDRFGPKKVLIVCAMVGITANVIYWFAPSMTFFRVARLLEGAAIVHIYTASPAFIMATTEGKMRPKAMSFWATYMPVGTAVGLFLGGANVGTDDWRNVFMLHGVLFFIAGCGVLFQPTLARSAAEKIESLGQRVMGLKQAYSRPILLLLALAFFMMISMGLGANTTFPSYFAKLHDMSVTDSSNLIALLTLAMVPGSIGVGALLARGVPYQKLFIGIAGLAFLAGTFTFFPPLALPFRTFATVLWFFTTGATVAAILATLPVVAEPHRRGAAAALINQAGAMATFVNPPIWLSIAAGDDWTPFVGLLALGWTVAVLSIWWIARSSRNAKSA